MFYPILWEKKYFFEEKILYFPAFTFVILQRNLQIAAMILWKFNYSGGQD